jgi:predicted dehydrogenase
MTRMRRREFVETLGYAAIGVGAAGSLQSARSARATASNEKIKIGQIGTAHAHASGKIETIRKLADDYELVGVVEPDADRRRIAETQKAYRDVKWTTEEQLLNTAGLKVVAVETAVRDLVPTAARCVAAGTHVHLDKPAGESLGEFKKLLDEATRKKRVVQMGYMFRYHPAFQLCFKAVREGWLGEIFETRGFMSKAINAVQRKELVPYSGGAMFELGCHLIDILVRMQGKPDKVTAFVRRTRPRQDSLADDQLAVFEYPKDVATIHVALMEVEGERRRQFAVSGDQGTADIRPLEPARMTLVLSRAVGEFTRGSQEVNLPPLTGRYDGDFLDLARIVRGEKEPDFGPEHDLAVHETILRASGLVRV